MADSPLERLVNQRFVGKLRDVGRTIEGRWELSPDGTAWELDFLITYRKPADSHQAVHGDAPGATRIPVV